MREDTDEAREGKDLVASRAARDEIARVIGDLATRPLDEHAAERMRRALAGVPAARVRGALRRLSSRQPVEGQAACVVTWLGASPVGGVW